METKVKGYWLFECEFCGWDWQGTMAEMLPCPNCRGTSVYKKGKVGVAIFPVKIYEPGWVIPSADACYRIIGGK